MNNQPISARIDVARGTCTPTPGPRVNGSSPWGTIQYLTELAPGIVSVSTASHGGIWISPERERTIPPAVQAIARQYAPAGWYEEDCDAGIPIVWFASELEPAEARAIQICRDYIKVDPRMAPVLEALQERAAAEDPDAIEALRRLEDACHACGRLHDGDCSVEYTGDL